MRDWLTDPLKRLCLLLATVPLVFLIGFIARYGASVPIVDDTLGLTAPVVIRARIGAFSPIDLFKLWNGHRVTFTLATAVVNYWLTGWNQYVEYGVSVALAVTNVALVVGLFARHRPGTAHWLLVPVAALFLSPHLGIVWTSSIYTVWHSNLFVVLLTVLLLDILQPGRRKLVIVNFLAIAALLTMAGGAALWGVIVIYLLLTPRERDYRAVGFTVVVAVLALLLYTQGGDAVGVTTGDPGNANNLILASPWAVIKYVLVILGGPLAFEQVGVALWAAAAALTVFTVNTVYLISRGDWLAAKPWLLVALYAGAVSVLVALSRVQLGLGVALQERYNMIGLLAWAALMALMLAVVRDPHGVFGRVLLNVNTVLAVVMVGLYAFTLHTTTGTLQGEITVEDHMALVDCYRAHPLRDLSSCAPGFRRYEYDVLAGLDLAAFRNAPRTLALGDRYMPGDQVVIHTDDAWYSVHVRDQLLDGVPANDVMHWAADADEAVQLDDYAPHLNPPLVNLYSWDDTDAPLDQWTGETGRTLWWVSRAVWMDDLPSPPDTLYTNYAQQSRLIREDGLSITRYQPFPPMPNTDLSFGDVLRLVHVDTPLMTVAACAEVPLRTFWEATRPLDDAHTITATLVDADNVAFARADAPPQTPITAWEPGRAYVDERTLTVPCDTVPGDYPLLLGVYPTATVELLTATDTSGAGVGSLITMTVVTVE